MWDPSWAVGLVCCSAEEEEEEREAAGRGVGTLTATLCDADMACFTWTTTQGNKKIIESQ